MVDEETASDEDEERGEVVADEEEVAWEEGDVVEEVHGDTWWYGFLMEYVIL